MTAVIGDFTFLGLPLTLEQFPLLFKYIILIVLCRLVKPVAQVTHSAATEWNRKCNNRLAICGKFIREVDFRREQIYRY